MTLNWITISNGRMALSPRRSIKTLQHFPEMGATRIVTLPGKNEQPLQIGNAAADLGLAWTWIPHASGRFPEGEADQVMKKGLREVLEHLAAGDSLVIHCAAGIHRTGMLAYAVLRKLGATEAEAREKIGEMRMITLEGMQEQNFRWGNLLVGG